MRFKKYLIVIIVLLPALQSVRGKSAIVNRADRRLYLNHIIDSTKVTTDATADSIARAEQTRRFYDSLAVKSDRNFFSRLLYKLLVVPSSSGPTQKDPLKVTDAAAPYRVFKGKNIASIEVVRYNIFERATSYVEKAANAVHVKTLEGTVRRDILFKEGQEVDPDLIALNRQLLNSRSYFYNAAIELSPTPGDSTSVNVKVITHDTWTINAAADIGGLSGRISGELYDVNLFGTGNRFSYKLSADWKDWKYEGSQFAFYAPNIFGSFLTANITAGRSFKYTQYSATLNKRLIRSSDYEVGAEYAYWDRPWGILFVNEALGSKSADITFRNFDVWAGKSFKLPRVESSIYAMARVYGIEYEKREFSADYDEPLPPLKVEYWKNPYFHNRHLYLGTLGIYREKFVTTNMIYGYGLTEYVATGYKAEVAGGWVNGEFESGPYAGLSFRMGNFTSWGYFMGDLALGGFYDTKRKKPFQSALNVTLDYFTNMIPIGSANLRQFVTMKYVKGWNREEGADEWIRLSAASGPRDIYAYTYGRERFSMNTETVVFTPWQPLGFRIALYGFLDAAFIGTNKNVFNNEFYSAIGIGVRMKNEMFIFGTIQLSLSIAFNKRGLVRNDWIMLDYQQRMQSPRYLPNKPEVVEYK